MGAEGARGISAARRGGRHCGDDRPCRHVPIRNRNRARSETGRDALPESRGVEKDEAAALDYFRRAAKLDHAEAAYRLGEAYADGRGVLLDAAQAADWFRRAALRDHPGAARQLALIYAEGRGVDKDPDLAAVWSRIAARLADSTARKSK